MIYKPEYICIDIGGYQFDLDQRLYFICEYHEALGAIRETGGVALAPSEPAYYEITGVRVMTPDGKTHNANWILDYISDDQMSDIKQNIKESFE